MFDKADLIYRICSEIRKNRDNLVNDIVSYHDDSVRFMRRVRMLSQLDLYESQIILKLYNFSADDLCNNDEFMKLVLNEIHLITNVSS